MTKIDIDLWVNYHLNRKKYYTEKEMSEIEASEFAMHLLIPTKKLLQMVDLNEYYKDSVTGKMITIQKLASIFKVPTIAVSIKLDELVERNIILHKKEIMKLVDIEELKDEDSLEQMQTIKHLSEEFGVTYEEMNNRLEEISNNLNKPKKKFKIRRLFKK